MHTLGHVSESGVALGIEPWVEPSKWALAGGNESIVDKGEDRCGSRGGSRGAVHVDEHTIPGNCEVDTVGRKIGISATRAVVEVGELIAKDLEVTLDGRVLEARTLEIVAEAATTGEAVSGIVGDDFGVEVDGC